MSPRRNWDSPKTASVPLPPEPGGGHTRLRVRGWGSHNSDDWRKSLTLCLLSDSYIQRTILLGFFCHATSLPASPDPSHKSEIQPLSFIKLCTHTNNMRPPHPFIKVIGISRIDWKRSIYRRLSFADWTVVKMLSQCSVLLLASSCLWGLCSAVFIGTRTCQPRGCQILYSLENPLFHLVKRSFRTQSQLSFSV